MSSTNVSEQTISQGRVPEHKQRGDLHRGYKYQSYERDSFNTHQNFLYKRALFGISMYEPEELKIMHWDKRRRIHKVNKHAQGILNVWKQQIINTVTNAFFSKLFANSFLVKDIIGKFGSYTDPEFINTIDFKSLGISKKDIVDKLIIEGVLPIDFYELKPLKKNAEKYKQEVTYKTFKFKAKSMLKLPEGETNLEESKR